MSSIYSSYLQLPHGRIYKYLYDFYLWLSAFTNPIWWILDKKTKTILDVGCGQGYPMQILKMVVNIEATGIDLFDDYLKEAKRLKIYNNLVKADVTNLPYEDKTFDTVICLQVIEHLPKKNGLAMLKKLEKIARHQIIITTPSGFFDHPETDKNELQKHHSGWNDKDFKELGYKVRHQGLNIFFGNGGLVHRRIPKFLRAFIFVLDRLLMPIYFFFPGLSDYWIIAFKRID